MIKNDFKIVFLIRMNLFFLKKKILRKKEEDFMSFYENGFLFIFGIRFLIYMGNIISICCFLDLDERG